MFRRDPITGQWGNRFLFTGREWLNELRIYDYRARQYQPELGRFLQPDPQEFAAGDYNLYRYCHNDPVNKSDPTGMATDFMWDFARYGDSANTSQGTFAEFTHGAYMGDTRGGDTGGDGRRYTMAGQSEVGPQKAQNQAVRQGDGYSSSPVDAALQREQDAKKIARGDTEGVVEIGQDKTNPRQFYATVAHDGNKDPSNFKDKVKQDNAPVATSWIDPAHLPKNYTLVGGLIAHRLYSTGRAGEDIQRAKDHNWRTFIVTAPERKVPVIYDKYTSPNPKF
jgi:RHS repeat-associated protein